MAATAGNAPDREAATELLGEHVGEQDKPEVVGDSAYGDAATAAHLEEQGFAITAKCQPTRNSGGRFPQDRLTVDLDRGTVTCPARQTAAIVSAARGGGRASFRPWCPACPLRSACTASRRGRTIAIHSQQAVLQRARAAQRDPAWQDHHRTGRPVVERKISHSTRRAWGGRNARTRVLARITTDLVTRAGKSTGPGSPPSDSTTTEPAGHWGDLSTQAPKTTNPSQPSHPSQPGRPAATTAYPKDRTAGDPGQPMLQRRPRVLP